MIKRYMKISAFIAIFVISGLFFNNYYVNASYDKKTGVNIVKVKNEIGGIHIFWDKMDDVDGYSIYRKKSSEKNFSYLKLISKEYCDFLDESVENNVIYSYKVCSFNYIEDKRSFGFFGNSVSSCIIKSPSCVNIYPCEEGINITWDIVNGCNGYSIYRKSQNEKNYTYLKLIPSNVGNYIDKDVEKGVAYSYKIYSYISYYGKRFFSGPSIASASRPYIDTPSILSLKKENNNSLILKWNKINGADGYSIYRKSKNDSSFTFQKMVTTESYIDSVKNIDEQYSYKVCAYTCNNGKCFFGCFSIPSKYIAVNTPRHMLTIIDDDGCNSFCDKFLPIVQNKGVSISTAIETGNVGKANYMSWEKIEKCYNEGAEILNHSRDHIVSKEESLKRTDDEINDDMLSSIEMLKQHGYLDTADIYVYPGASAGNTWRNASTIFRAAINSSGSETNIRPLRNRYNLHRYPVGSKSVPTYQEMKKYVDEVAAINDGWQIWMIHSNNGNITSDAIEDICNIIDYCKEVNVEIVSAKEALDYYDTFN